ncbi:MAG: site-2 protease family protein [Candidatus Pacebacteria bacterium]|nr:site-2 protease family protein [Candidatus Paceibacterota bacterium]
MNTLLIAFFSIIFLLILHEFGHFITAKKFGIRVEEFGIGYPPRLFGKKFGETLYSLNLLPFGAFVRIPGVEETGGGKNNKVPAWQRAMVLLGGVVSFWIIAVILLSSLFIIGAPQSISDEEGGNLINPKVQIMAVAAGSPAEVAGLRAGDAIQGFKIQNTELKIDKVKDVQEFTEQYKGQEVIVTVERGKEVFETSLVPRVSPPEGEGAMGIALVRTAEKSYPPLQAFIKGAQSTGNLTVAVFVGWGQVLGNLISGRGIPKGVQFMGPIGIGNLINQAAQAGINYFLQFIAIIAIYLAVFNFLPIPALDGGKLLFLGIEKIKGSPINPKIEENITAGFFVVLVGLMIWFTIQDISRLF